MPQEYYPYPMATCKIVRDDLAGVALPPNRLAVGIVLDVSIHQQACGLI